MSPWDGASRVPLRVLLAALMTFDAGLGAWFLWSLRPTSISHPNAPAWLLGLGSHRPAIGALAAVGIVSAIAFGASKGRIVWGLASLFCVGVLVEAQASLLEGPMRFLFFTGAAMTGWLLGLLSAKVLDTEVDSVETLAEQGAIGALAACYLGAFASKVEHTGIRWAYDSDLRATVAAQHSWGSSRWLDALAQLVIDTPWPEVALSTFTLLAQASAILLPFSRMGRSVSATLILAFHTGVWVLTPISFPQASLLLLGFGFPWPAWLPSLFRRHVHEEPDHVPVTRRLGLPVVLIVAIAAVAWSPAVRRYTELHHNRPARSTPPTAQHRAWLGGVDVGSRILSYEVVGLSADEDALTIRFQSGQSVIVAEVVAKGTRPHSAPVSTDGLDLFYKGSGRGSDPLPVLRELATRLRPESKGRGDAK